MKNVCCVCLGHSAGSYACGPCVGVYCGPGGVDFKHWHKILPIPFYDLNLSSADNVMNMRNLDRRKQKNEFALW